MKVTVVTHYDKNDIDFEGDYKFIEIFINDALSTKYWDWYHDKGDAKTKGFLDALICLDKLDYIGELNIEKLEIADVEK